MSAADDAYAAAERAIAEAKVEKAKALSFDSSETRALTRLPPEIGTIEKLNYLALDNTQVTDLTPLNGLTGLFILFLRNTQVSDLAPLQALTGLRELFLTNTQVTDLAPLQALTGLRTLDLDKTQVTDLAALQALTGLQTLYFTNTQVTDLAPLQALTGLQVLDLAGTQVTDLAPLQALTGLQALRLAGTQVSDLRPICDLASLVEGAKGESFYKPGLQFQNTPATRADPELKRLSEIEDDADRTEATLAYLRTLPPWPQPLQTPPAPTGEPRPPELDPALHIVATDEGLDLAPVPTAPDPVTEAALEELRRLIDLLSRKANQHDDLRGLTDRARVLLEDSDTPPDALRLHLVYQGLRRLHAGRVARPEPFDAETVAALDGLQDCVPGITLGNTHVQKLLDRQRLDRESPRPGIDRAREEAVLGLLLEEGAPVSDALRDVTNDVLAAEPDEPLGALRRVLSRNVVIKALMAAGAGTTTLGIWVLSQSPEIQSLAASIGDDAYWWARATIDKIRAALESRTMGP